jgi:hypothetical protein
MSWFIKFMVSPVGRAARLIAGIVLLAGGLLVVGGTIGFIVAAIGLVPLFAGTVDACVFAPFFGFFLSGSRTRAAL